VTEPDAAGAPGPEIRALADELLPLFYDELKRAARRRREMP
jgi:hypothetical protein